MAGEARRQPELVQSDTRSTIAFVQGRRPAPRWPCQGERLLAGPVDAAVVTAHGGGCPLSESREPLGPSRGSAPQSRSGREEGRWAGRGGGGGGGEEVGGGAGRAASSWCSSSVMGVPVVHRRVLTVQTVQLTVESRQVPFLGLVLDMPVVVHRQCVADVPVIMQRQVPAV